MTTSFNNRTGNLFGTDRAGATADLNQSVVDRLLTLLESRPWNPAYGSLLPIAGQIGPEALADSIDAAVRSDTRVTDVEFSRVGDEFRVSINGAAGEASVAADDTTAVESPVYRALLRAIQDAVGDDYDLRQLLAWQNAPIAYIRGYVETVSLAPHTTLLGEGFERGVAQNAYRFFTERDQLTILDLYAELGQMGYTYRIQRDGSLWTCFTPSPLRDEFDAPLTEAVRDAVAWMMPFYEGAVTVVECAQAQAEAEARVFTSPPVLVVSNV